ncbi:hypothetical protein SLA2020_005670 [Shorea laevis]
MTCIRCCLHNSLKISNLIMNLLGIAMIIYCLWLQKKWDEGVSQLPTIKDLPRPWFIYASLGVGISICLSTVFGYIVGNSLSSSTLAVYIVSICSLVFLQVAVIVTIFFNFDWSKEIAKYIDERHQEFESFVIFHLRMCQFIAIMILVPQVTIVALGIILLTIGSERMTRIRNSVIPDFTRSFLVVGSESGLLDGSGQTCSTCESLRMRGSPQRSCLSFIKAVLSMQVQRNSN